MKNKRFDLNTKYRAMVSFDDFSNASDIMVSYYLPIIGSESFTLYMALMTDSRNELIRHNYITIEERLLPMINMSIEKISEAIIKLEILKLIEVFVEENGNVNFKLIKPLSPSEFNESEHFSQILRTACGNSNLEISNRLFNSLKNDNVEGATLSTEKVDLTERINVEPARLNVEVNIDSVKDVLNARGIDWSVFWTSEIESKLSNFILLYEVSALDIAIELMKEHESGEFDIGNVEKRLSKAFSTIRDVNSLITAGDNTTEVKFELMGQLSMRDFFIYRLDRVPTSDEEKMIQQLKTKNKLNDEMIQVLIDFSILSNDGAIVPNYITKIASTVVKDGIKDTAHLMRHLKTAYKVKKNKASKTDEEISKLYKAMDDVPEF